jgi:pimeloyl-ACP methyl ester carboxylesterase
MQKNPSIPRDWGHLYDAILPKSELVTIDHAGHDPWLADPAYFFKRAKQFIMDNK